MLRVVSGQEFYPTSPLSRSAERLLPSNVFPHFLCVFLSLSTPALIFLLVCWQRPGWSNCGFWRAPRVWSRHGWCQGGHVRSSLALCPAGCGAGGGAWMDGWMVGWAWAAGMHSDLSADAVLLDCFPSACVDVFNNCCFLCSVSLPKAGPPVSHRKPSPSSLSFLFTPSNTYRSLFVLKSLAVNRL